MALEFAYGQSLEASSEPGFHQAKATMALLSNWRPECDNQHRFLLRLEGLSLEKQASIESSAGRG